MLVRRRRGRKIWTLSCETCCADVPSRKPYCAATMPIAMVRRTEREAWTALRKVTTKSVAIVSAIFRCTGGKNGEVFFLWRQDLGWYNGILGDVTMTSAAGGPQSLLGGGKPTSARNVGDAKDEGL